MSKHTNNQLIIHVKISLMVYNCDIPWKWGLSPLYVCAHIYMTTKIWCSSVKLKNLFGYCLLVRILVNHCEMEGSVPLHLILVTIATIKQSIFVLWYGAVYIPRYSQWLPYIGITICYWHLHAILQLSNTVDFALFHDKSMHLYGLHCGSFEGLRSKVV